MFCVFLLIFLKCRLVKAVWPMAWTWLSTAVDNSPKYGFIALISTPHLPPPTSESPRSASNSSIGVGNFWGAWPWPAQPSSFHPQLFQVEGDVPVMWAVTVQGQGIWLAPTHCRLPQRPTSNQTHVWSLSVWLNHCWEVQSPFLSLEKIVVYSIIHFLHNTYLKFFNENFSFFSSSLIPNLLVSSS